MRQLTVTAIAIVAIAGLSKTGVAQVQTTPEFSQPIGFHARSTSGVRAAASISDTVQTRVNEARHYPGRFFLTGALAGGVVLGAVAAIGVSKCADDCMFAGPYVAIATGAGALGGGLAGLLVYAFRYAHWGNQ